MRWSVPVAVVFIGILWLYSSIGQGAPEKTLTLETRTIPKLAPHEHDIHEDTIEDAGHGVEMTSPIYRSSTDLWVTGIDYENVNASAFVLHHALLTSASSSLTWCSNDLDSRNFMIMTEDQMSDPHVRFPAGYALRIPAGTPLLLYAMFHNPEPPLGSGETFKKVKGKMILHLAPDSEIPSLKQLKYYSPHLADQPCKPKDLGYLFTVPANTPEFRMTGSDGPVHPQRISFDHPVTIKFWGAHLHGWEGGEDLIVKKNAAEIGSFATKRSTWDRYMYLTPQSPADIRLAPGDVLSLEARYSNPSAEPVVGAMAILYMYVSDE